MHSLRYHALAVGGALALALAALGCGGSGTPELTAKQAQDVATKEAGELLTCSGRVAVSEGSEIWWCARPNVAASCWEFSYDDGQDSWYTIDQREYGDARVGVSQPGCPEYGETEPPEASPSDRPNTAALIASIDDCDELLRLYDYSEGRADGEEPGSLQYEGWFAAAELADDRMVELGCPGR